MLYLDVCTKLKCLLSFCASKIKQMKVFSSVVAINIDFAQKFCYNIKNKCASV